jgi:hypothetical protein
MRITNRHDLPQTIMNVLARPQYSKGKAHLSCTELLNSPRIVQLKSKHFEEIEQDASEMIWSLFGTAVHNILEHGKDSSHVVEERLHISYNGWNISGAIDLQEITPEGIVLSDYKVTGAWSVMNEKDDWHNQLNIYAWMVETIKKVPVVKAQIVAIIRDWSARDAATRENYPPSPVAVIDIPVWSLAEREAYINKRLDMHNQAYFATETGGDLPLCDESDMWEKPTLYAVKKEGGVRAKSVHKTKEDAEQALQNLKGYVLEVREGERTRCKSYCPVSSFCSQYKEYLNQPD